jgi:hypothetical protein
VGWFAGVGGTWRVGVDFGDESWGAGSKGGRAREGAKRGGRLGSFGDGVEGEGECAGRGGMGEGWGRLGLCLGLNFVQLKLTIEDR